MRLKRMKMSGMITSYKKRCDLRVMKMAGMITTGCLLWKKNLSMVNFERVPELLSPFRSYFLQYLMRWNKLWYPLLSLFYLPLLILVVW